MIRKEGAVAWISWSNPKAMNALSFSIVDQIVADLETYEMDPSLRVAVLKSESGAFAAGANIKEFADQNFSSMLSKPHLKVWERIRKIQKPIIASVESYALGGGCELAMSADLIIASDDALFGQPEIKLGIMPGAGGTVRWTKAVGRFKAAQILLLAENMKAEEAKEAGIVYQVVPKENLLEETKKLADKIASLPPLAVITIKKTIQYSLESPELVATEWERMAFASLFSTKDKERGVQAFIEKRKTDFFGD